jgi:hypothetical protein
MKIRWDYVWAAAFGAFMSSVGLTFRRWEFYVALALFLAYGIAKESTAQR